MDGNVRFIALGLLLPVLPLMLGDSVSAAAATAPLDVRTADRSHDDRRSRRADDDHDDDDDDDEVGTGGSVGGRDDDVDDPDTTVGYDDRPADLAWPEAIGLANIGASVDGSGVTVAVIDTGVTPAPELGDRVVARVDLTPDGDGYDRYGHGTHMIGLVAGAGVGVAPGADIVSIKVASWDGATDPSAVIGGLMWVAAHHEQYGIRVVNVSYGTDSSQKYLDDPLDYAVEQLWKAGIVVVAAAGNRGAGGAKIDKPGDDPFVLTVGAADLHGTVRGADDEVAPFSSCGPTGDNIAKPDLVAPGVSIVSTRAPGSTVDALRPSARLGADRFKGTGTSQATAIVSGIAALMLDAEPGLTPDEVKAALIATTSSDLAGQACAGAGVVHAGRAVEASAAGVFAGADVHADIEESNGRGSIDATRGNHKPYTDLDGDGVAEQVSGELDVLGEPWNPDQWASGGWGPDTWARSPWAPLTIVSEGWDATARPANTWPGTVWDAPSWSAKSWREAGWTADTWTAKSWRDANWNSFGGAVSTISTDAVDGTRGMLASSPR